MEDCKPQKTKVHPSKMVEPIIPLARPESDELGYSKYVYHICHNTSGDINLLKYVIKIPKFDSATPEVVICTYLVQTILVGQNIITIPLMYKCM